MRLIVLASVVLLIACGSEPQKDEAQREPVEQANETVLDLSNAKAEAEAQWPTMALPDGAPEAPVSGSCSDDMCVTTQVQFANSDWPKAWSGDYAGQRNAAFCRKTGCNGAVQVNVIEACAWRLLIMASHTMEVDETDTANLEMDCNTLRPADLDASQRKANVMAGVISGQS